MPFLRLPRAILLATLSLVGAASLAVMIVSGRHFFRALLCQIENPDFGTGGGQRLRAGETDAVGSACNDRTFVHFGSG